MYTFQLLMKASHAEYQVVNQYLYYLILIFLKQIMGLQFFYYEKLHLF